MPDDVQKAVIQHAQDDMRNAPPMERVQAAVEEKSLLGVIGEIITEEILPAVEAEGKQAGGASREPMKWAAYGLATPTRRPRAAHYGTTPGEPQEINVNVRMPDASDRAQYQSQDRERDLGR